MRQDYYKDKNIFVAGGAGLIGQSITKQLLERGAHVLATQYIKRKITTEHPNLSVIELDLRDIESVNKSMKDMDVLFLCGSKVGGAKAILYSAVDLVFYNLTLQFNLMHLAFKHKLDKVGFISSSYIYPDTGKPNIESEGFVGDPWKPTNYGLGWLVRYLETVCKFLHSSGNTKYAIIRPTSIYGPNGNFDFETCHAIPALIRRFAEKQDPLEIWGNGLDIRCHTYVDDVANGLLEVTDKYSVAEALNICSTEETTIKQVVDTLCKIENVTPIVHFDATKPSMIPYKVSSPKMAKELLGWQHKVSLEEGLTKTIKWYKENR